jgi:hypothetical protein
MPNMGDLFGPKSVTQRYDLSHILVSRIEKIIANLDLHVMMPSYGPSTRVSLVKSHYDNVYA